MRQPIRFAAALLFATSAAFALACSSMSGGGGSAHMPTLPWNQQAVTSLAGKLSTATDTAYQAVIDSPETVEVGEGVPGASMGGSLQEMQDQTRGLHDALESGQDMQQTLGRYRRIKELSRDLSEASNYSDEGTSEGGPLGAITPLLSQLDGFYGTQ